MPKYIHHFCIQGHSTWQTAHCVMHCSKIKRGPKNPKKGTQRGPNFEQKGDQKGTQRSFFSELFTKSKYVKIINKTNWNKIFNTGWAHQSFYMWSIFTCTSWAKGHFYNALFSVLLSLHWFWEDLQWSTMVRRAILCVLQSKIEKGDPKHKKGTQNIKRGPKT